MILTTKYSGPTDTRGSRILVYVGSRKAKQVHIDPAWDSCEMHEKAALYVARKLRPELGWIVATNLALPDGNNHDRVVILEGV